MAIQFSESIRNARLDAIETVTGTAAKLQIREGSPPANTGLSDSGTLLAELDLPSDWLADASGGSKAKAGTWDGTAVAGGTAGHFRVKDSTGTTTTMQGTVSESGGGGDLILNNTSINEDDPITINTFVLTDGNA